MPAIVTPCVKVCFIDDASGLCLGCWRSLNEIADWATMSVDEREAVLRTLPTRQAACDSPDENAEAPD